MTNYFSTEIIMPFRIRLSEPANARYIYVNPVTNTVHLLLPLASGAGIALDNTCKTGLAMQEFFGKKSNSSIMRDSARHSLMRYKVCLESDISALDAGDLKSKKRDRLQQVTQYIQILEAIEADASLNCLSGGFPNFPDSIQNLMRRQTNLHTMVLRPDVQDRMLRTPAPLFRLDRDRHNNTFYHVAAEVFRTIQPAASAPVDPKKRLISLIERGFKLPISLRTLLATAPQALTRAHKTLFGNDFDYTLTPPRYGFVKLTDPAKLKKEALKQIFKGSSGYILCNNELFFVEAPAYLVKKIAMTAEILAQITPMFPAATDVMSLADAPKLSQITALTMHTLPDPILRLGIFSSLSMDDPEITDLEELQNELDTLITYRVGEDADLAFASTPSPFSRITHPVVVNTINIMTQFLLAHINFFAHDVKKTSDNFGAILDADPSLASQLANVVKTSIETNGNVEQAVCAFINSQKKVFKLSADLTAVEVAKLS
jgi:hypothetical protein